MTIALSSPNSSPAPNDALGEVARSAIRRDEFAQEHVLRDLRGALYPHVRRLSRKYGGGNGEIDDIVQETLLAFHNHRDRMDPRAPVLPWLYAVARNKTIDARRRQNLRERMAREPSMQPYAIEPCFACERSDLLSLLGLLSGLEQAILRRTTLEGRTVAEAALDFGVSKVHARVIKHRAIRKLSTIIGKTKTRSAGALRQ